jgi:hypothetical protein
MAANVPLLLRRLSEAFPNNDGHGSREISRSSKSKASSDGMKLTLRRLPPGITETEVVTILGDDWKLGNGKVSYWSWNAGKIAREYVLSHAL